jgi:arylsulfatase A-like enzyme
MNQKVVIKKVLFVFIIALISCKNQTESTSLNPSPSPNIVFIAVDDLRTDLGSYGNTTVKSPNLDELAKEGTLFTNHYVQVPTCGASRHSLLTGIRPISRAYLKNNISEKVLSDKEEGVVPETFIHQLKRSGYHTVGIGKISHSTDGYLYGYNGKLSTKRELPHSWDELLFNYGKWETGWNAFFGYSSGENRQSMKKQVKPYEKGAVTDTGYVDGLTTQLALSKLKTLKDSSKPFFLGVGFFKPHLPFNSPEKYWGLYNRDSISISPNPTIPSNVHLSSLHSNWEFNQYQLGEEKPSLGNPISDAYSKKLRHAYYACISYIDAQIGLIVDEIEKLGLDENTIIVVWGDHGWHLGDQQVWGKHTIFENALKSTLIVKVPGKNNSNGVTSVVESVDIYPTLMELCNIELSHSIDGESFAGQLEDNNLDNNSVAYSYYKDGITLRTDRYRLTQYYREEEPKIELYDHKNDPYETTNIAEDHTEIVDKLMPLLQKGNTGLYN